MTARSLRSAALRLGFLAGVLAFCAAPVPGDIGGCSQRAQELDPEAFLEVKHGIDCTRCTECGLDSRTCRRACDGTLRASLPDGCVPLVHDGEVCLRALLAASCDDYGEFTRDEAPTTPSECNFCPRRVP